MKFWAVLAVSAVLGAGIWAAAAEQKPVVQQPAQQPLQADEPTRIQVDVTRVNMLYTVTDRKGRFVTNLTKEHSGVQRRERSAASPGDPDRYQQQHTGAVQV
jgi:hypothetical protein